MSDYSKGCAEGEMYKNRHKTDGKKISAETLQLGRCFFCKFLFSQANCQHFQGKFVFATVRLLN